MLFNFGRFHTASMLAALLRSLSPLWPRISAPSGGARPCEWPLSLYFCESRFWESFGKGSFGKGSFVCLAKSFSVACMAACHPCRPALEYDAHDIKCIASASHLEKTDMLPPKLTRSAGGPRILRFRGILRRRAARCNDAGRGVCILGRLHPAVASCGRVARRSWEQAATR